MLFAFCFSAVSHTVFSLQVCDDGLKLLSFHVENERLRCMHCTQLTFFYLFNSLGWCDAINSLSLFCCAIAQIRKIHRHCENPLNVFFFSFLSCESCVVYVGRELEHFTRNRELHTSLLFHSHFHFRAEIKLKRKWKWKNLHTKMALWRR